MVNVMEMIPFYGHNIFRLVNDSNLPRRNQTATLVAATVTSPQQAQQAQQSQHTQQAQQTQQRMRTTIRIRHRCRNMIRKRIRIKQHGNMGKLFDDITYIQYPKTRVRQANSWSIQCAWPASMPEVQENLTDPLAFQ